MSEICSSILSSYIRNSCEYYTESQRRTLNIDIAINHIIEFVRRRKRVIYGGFLCHLITGCKFNDIDFYSPDPVSDVIYITNEMLTLGYMNVHSREALHKGTYTIMVNYIRVCDVSYSALDFPFNSPIFKDLKCIDPVMLVCDYLYMISDIPTNYNRVDTLLKRLYNLMFYIQYLPYLPECTSVCTSGICPTDVKSPFIFPCRDSLISCGYEFFVYFLGYSENNNHRVYISTDYVNDIRYILDNIRYTSYTEYTCYLHGLGRSVCFNIDHHSIRIYDSRNKVVPVTDRFNGFHVCSFSYGVSFLYYSKHPLFRRVYNLRFKTLHQLTDPYSKYRDIDLEYKGFCKSDHEKLKNRKWFKYNPLNDFNKTYNVSYDASSGHVDTNDGVAHQLLTFKKYNLSFNPDIL